MSMHCKPRALRWRYLTLAIFLATLIITAGMAGGGLLRFEFFPSVEADFMSAAVTMPQGTPAEMTSNVVRRLEASAAQVRREMEDRTGRDLFQHVYAAVGDQPMVAQAAGPFGFAGAESASHLGEVTIELARAEDRDITSEELSNRWRELAGPIPEAVELKFNSSLLSPADDIDVQLTGPDLDELRGGEGASDPNSETGDSEGGEDDDKKCVTIDQCAARLPAGAIGGLAAYVDQYGPVCYTDYRPNPLDPILQQHGITCP